MSMAAQNQMIVKEDDNMRIALTEAMSDGQGGWQPTPAVLTEQEAIQYLRLNVNGPKNPAGTLKYYRERGLLHAVQIGRQRRYLRVELDRFLARLLDGGKGSR